MTHENVLERSSPVIVQVGAALTDSAERRRIIVRIANFILQSHIIGRLRGILRRRVTPLARLSAENFPPTLDSRVIGPARQAEAGRRLRSGRMGSSGVA